MNLLILSYLYINWDSRKYKYFTSKALYVFRNFKKLLYTANVKIYARL